MLDLILMSPSTRIQPLKFWIVMGWMVSFTVLPQVFAVAETGEDSVPVVGDEEPTAAKLPPDINMEPTPTTAATPLPEGEPTLPTKPEETDATSAPIEAKAYDLKTVRP